MKKIENLKLLIDVVISKPGLINSAEAYSALIDTGATKSFISETVVNTLSLDASNFGTMTDVSNIPRKVSLYTCNILLENHQKTIRMEVGIFTGRPECDMIIGVDIIKHGRLLVDGELFSFDINILK
jgi:predicted aspartyl protease